MVHARVETVGEGASRRLNEAAHDCDVACQYVLCCKQLCKVDVGDKSELPKLGVKMAEVALPHSHTWLCLTGSRDV